MNMTRPPAGRYVKTQDTADAFIPDPLPPGPDIWTFPKLICLLSEADRQIGMLDGMAKMLPNLDLMVMMFMAT